MPNYGFGTLALGSGAAEGLDTVLKRRIQERQMALMEQQAQQQQAFQEAQMLQQQAELGQRKQEGIDRMAELGFNRRIAEQARVTGQANTLADDLTPGMVLPQMGTEAQTLQAGGRGSLLKANVMPPSEAMGKPNMGQPGRMGARPITADYKPGSYTYEGTAGQTWQREQAESGREERAGARAESQDFRREMAGMAADRMGDKQAWFSAGSPRLREDGTWVQAFYSRTQPGEQPKVVEVPMEAGSRPKPTEGGLQKEANSISGLATLRKLDAIAAKPDFEKTVLYRAIPGSPFARLYDALGSELGDLLARLRTGAQINEEEMKLYGQKFLPNAGDIVLDDPAGTRETINFKIGKFRALFKRLARSGGLTDAQVEKEVEKTSREMDALPGQGRLMPPDVVSASTLKKKGG